MLHAGDQNEGSKGTKETQRPMSLAFFIDSENMKITGLLKIQSYIMKHLPCSGNCHKSKNWTINVLLKSMEDEIT